MKPFTKGAKMTHESHKETAPRIPRTRCVCKDWTPEEKKLWRKFVKASETAEHGSVEVAELNRKNTDPSLVYGNYNARSAEAAAALKFWHAISDTIGKRWRARHGIPERVK